MNNDDARANHSRPNYFLVRRMSPGPFKMPTRQQTKDRSLQLNGEKFLPDQETAADWQTNAAAIWPRQQEHYLCHKNNSATYSL